MKYFTIFLNIIIVTALVVLPSSTYGQKATAEFITSISPPALSDTIPVEDGNRYVTFHEDLLFIVNRWAGVQIVDVENIRAPQMLSFIKTKDMAQQADVQNNRLFIANKSEGVGIYDISNPKNPVKLTQVNTPGDAYWVDAVSNHIYVALGSGGFCVMDISNLNEPRTLTLEFPQTWVWSIYHQNNKVYVAAKQGGLLVYDSSDPSSPKLLTEYKTGYQAIQMEIVDNFAYIADGPGGLLILDISSPNLPKKVARFNSEGFVGHVFKSGNYAYLANRELGLQIINVTDPTQPFLEGQYIPDTETYAVHKQDVHVFLITDSQTEILRHNNQPVLQALTNKTVDEDSSLVLQLQAHDPDGDPISYSAQNLPEGAELNAKTGLFLWKPTFEQSGTYPNIIFTVTESTGSQLSASDTIDITVKHINRLPELPSLANQTIPEDSLLTIPILKGSDPDSEDIGQLSYRAENLPQGAEFDSDSLLFSWKPTFEQAGDYVVDFVLDDGSGGTDRESVTITVEHVDRPPTLAPIENQTLAEGDTLSIQLTGEEPDQEDQNKINFSMKNLPEGARFDETTARLTWVPGYDQSGDYPNITAVMNAGNLADSSSFTTTINHVNRSPVLTEIGDKTVNENTLLQFNIQGSDPDVEDQGKLVYQSSNLPTGAAFDSDSLVFRWTPTFEQSGSYPNVTFSVTDPQGLSDQESITLTVTHVNRTPELASVPSFTIDEDSLLEYQLSASDPDEEDKGKLTYAANGLPEGAELDGTTGAFSWKPGFEQSATYDIIFTVTDGNLSDSSRSTITVNHVNRPPELQPLTDQMIDENETLSLNITGNDPDSEDAEKIVFAADNLPAGATFNRSTQTFTWTPTFEQSGIYPDISFSVTDPQGLTDQETISITVNHVNRRPQIEPVSPITVNEKELVSFKLSGGDPDEEDTGQLKYQITNMPDGAVINSSTGAFTWTPSFEQSGNYQLTAQVTDSAGLTANTTVNVTVNNVNRSPQIESLPPIAGNEGEAVSVNLEFSDPDQEDRGKLTVNVTGLPEGAEFDSETNTIRWTPSFVQDGNYEINYSVTDSYDASAEGSATIQVANVNRPPQAPEVSTLGATENETFSIVLPEGSDPDAQDAGKLIYNVENLPAGASFDPDSRTLKWTPEFDQAGSYQVSYIVSDPLGESDGSTAVLEVENNNRQPELQVVGNQQVSEGEQLVFTIQASDPDPEDDGKLKFSADDLPDGADFDSNSGTFMWTPGSDQQGEYTVTFKVEDDAGLSDQNSVTISVADVATETSSPPEEE